MSWENNRTVVTFCFVAALFVLAEGERLDVGNIFLDPIGILDLEVVDGKGKPLSSFKLFPADDEEEISRNSRVRDGVFRYEILPVGRFRFRVEAHKHKSREVTIDLLPAKPVEIRVVLEKG